MRGCALNRSRVLPSQTWVDDANLMRRLKTRAQFQAVLAGTVVARTAHFVLHRLPLLPVEGSQRTGDLLFAEPDVWVGAMLPKRWAKRAVTRHAIKRQIYNRDEWSGEAFAAHAHVVRMRSGFSVQSFRSAWSEPLRLAVRAELAVLMRRAQSAQSPAPKVTSP